VQGDVLAVGPPDRGRGRRRYVAAAGLLLVVVGGAAAYATWGTETARRATPAAPSRERLGEVLWADVHGAQVRDASGLTSVILDVSLGNSGHTTALLYSVGLGSHVMNLLGLLTGPPSTVRQGVLTFVRPMSLGPGTRTELELRLTSNSCRAASAEPATFLVQAQLGRAPRQTVTLRPTGLGGASSRLGFDCP
jgi:hypothetical protein